MSRTKYFLKKGAFNNYVDRFFQLFDPPLVSRQTNLKNQALYFINVAFDRPHTLPVYIVFECPQWKKARIKVWKKRRNNAS